jgi:hypothetical protein
MKRRAGPPGTNGYNTRNFSGGSSLPREPIYESRYKVASGQSGESWLFFAFKPQFYRNQPHFRLTKAALRAKIGGFQGTKPGFRIAS